MKPDSPLVVILFWQRLIGLYQKLIGLFSNQNLTLPRQTKSALSLAFPLMAVNSALLLYLKACVILEFQMSYHQISFQNCCLLAGMVTEGVRTSKLTHLLYRTWPLNSSLKPATRCWRKSRLFCFMIACTRIWHPFSSKKTFWCPSCRYGTPGAHLRPIESSWKLLKLLCLLFQVLYRQIISQ